MRVFRSYPFVKKIVKQKTNVNLGQCRHYQRCLYLFSCLNDLSCYSMDLTTHEDVAHKMAARHGTAGHEVIFVVLLVCLKSLIKPLVLNGLQIDSKSTGKPFPEFLTNNKRLWSIIVRDNSVHTTQKSVSTTGSFNHGRIVFYNNLCATFQLEGW